MLKAEGQCSSKKRASQFQLANLVAVGQTLVQYTRERQSFLVSRPGGEPAHRPGVRGQVRTAGGTAPRGLPSPRGLGQGLGPGGGLPEPW